jgi:hypothetical protein
MRALAVLAIIPLVGSMASKQRAQIITSVTVTRTAQIMYDALAKGAPF